MAHHYPELALALRDMAQQSARYQPTAFWQDAAARIANELQECGIEGFRRQSLPLGFFVPTYGAPGNSFSGDMVQGLARWLSSNHPAASKAQLGLGQFLAGQMAALADYRVLLAADNPQQAPCLHRFSESTAGNPVEQFEFDGRRFSRSALNYLLGLAMLKKHLPAGEAIRTVMEIGGGFGTLGEILFSGGNDAPRYIDLDIPPTSFVAQWYLQQSCGTSQVTTHAHTRAQTDIPIDALGPLSVLAAWQIERLRGSVDLFVNFISFQEMEPAVVQNYLNHVARLGTRWVLLRNMREGKQKRTKASPLGVETPIVGDTYLEMLPDYTLVARNVYPYGYRTVDGYHSELMLLRRI